MWEVGKEPEHVSGSGQTDMQMWEAGGQGGVVDRDTGGSGQSQEPKAAYSVLRRAQTYCQLSSTTKQGDRAQLACNSLW